MGSTIGKILDPPSDGNCFMCSRCRNSEETTVGNESDLKPIFPENLAVCIASIPFSVTEQDFLAYLNKCGDIQRSNFLKNEKGKFKGIAFVTFKTLAGRDAALKLDGGTYGGRTLKVNLAGQDDRPGKASAKAKDGKGTDDKDTNKADVEKEIFVGGIAFSCKEADLRKHFRQVGKIISLRMPVNEEGKFKGVAFIRFLLKEDDFEKALKLDGSTFMGRTLKVQEADKGLNGKGKGKRTGKK